MTSYKKSIICFLFRFICEGTIEERIENLQEQKKGVANNILGGFKINLNEMMNLI